MKKKYAVHADFAKYPSPSSSFNAPLAWTINTLVKIDRFVRCRKPQAGLTRTTHRFQTADGYSVPCVVIAPLNLAKPAPAVVYYHGGAYALTYMTMHMKMCERYALEANCIVVLVAYRLTPQHPFPTGFNDSFAALEWAITNASTLGIDPQRLVVMGDSAGGGMAASVAQKAFDNRIPLRAQVLIYPTLDSECKTYSATEFTDTPLLNAISVRGMWKMYLKNYLSNPPAYAAAGLRKNLAGLPPAYITTAEFDPLRDEGIAYAHALEAQGVPVLLDQTRATMHGFDVIAKNPETIRAVAGRIDFLRKSFA